jgi:IS1 family transposase
MPQSKKRKGKRGKKTRGARIVNWVFEKGSHHYLQELRKWFKKPEELTNLLPAWKKKKLGKPSGIYVLYKFAETNTRGRKSQGRMIYYVGKARGLTGRIGQHLKDRHRGKWDQFTAYGMGRRESETLETLLIKLANPEGNQRKRHKSFPGALDLRKEIRRYYDRKSNEFHV